MWRMPLGQLSILVITPKCGKCYQYKMGISGLDNTLECYLSRIIIEVNLHIAG